MPTDIVKDIDRLKLSSMDSDEFPQQFQSIKQIWQENDEVDSEIVDSRCGYLTEYSNNHFVSLKSFDFNFEQAQTEGFIVGHDLDKVKAKSRRSLMQQMSSHISKNFQSLYGKENNNNRQNYFQVGVRVPTKEHVSEIVGKQGIKIKEIRERSGALIITPGECEDHVFIIEALPQIALQVARTIAERAQEITGNRQTRCMGEPLTESLTGHSSSSSSSSCSTTGSGRPKSGKSSPNLLASPTGPGPLSVANQTATSSVATAASTGTKTSLRLMGGAAVFGKSFSMGQSNLRPILASGFIDVPKSIVGRIIGTHGSIITTIQKDTGTEIRSPPKDNSGGSNGSSSAKFEILVYQKCSNSPGGTINNSNNGLDPEEAQQRITNARQLIAHVAQHQMERIRAEESPFSNYRLSSVSSAAHQQHQQQQQQQQQPLDASTAVDATEAGRNCDKEQLLSYQMQSVAWLWPDIDRLDPQVAEDVVLRILEESKKKSKLRSEFPTAEPSSNCIGNDCYDDYTLFKQQHHTMNFVSNGSHGNMISPLHSAQQHFFSDQQHHNGHFHSNLQQQSQQQSQQHYQHQQHNQHIQQYYPSSQQPQFGSVNSTTIQNASLNTRLGLGSSYQPLSSQYSSYSEPMYGGGPSYEQEYSMPSYSYRRTEPPQQQQHVVPSNVYHPTVPTAKSYADNFKAPIFFSTNNNNGDLDYIRSNTVLSDIDTATVSPTTYNSFGAIGDHMRHSQSFRAAPSFNHK